MNVHKLILWLPSFLSVSIPKTNLGCQLWRKILFYVLFGPTENGFPLIKFTNLICSVGVEYGQKALEINNSSWKAHKWFAICVGGRGQLQSVKDKLRDGNMFKEHLDAAIAINPTDPALHHLVGRFNYEVITSLVQ